MVVSIDGEECTQLKTKDGTLSELLKEVKALLAGQGKMVVGIVCDGELLAPDVINTHLRRPLEEYVTIDFQTSKPEDLAKSSLEACRQFISDIEDRIEKVIGGLHKSNIPDAMREMGPLFSRLNETYQGLQGIFQLMKVDPQSVELSNGSAERAMVGMVRLLKDIKGSLENHDYVQLTDLFEYELKPAIKQWYQIIDNLGELLNREK